MTVSYIPASILISGQHRWKARSFPPFSSHFHTLSTFSFTSIHSQSHPPPSHLLPSKDPARPQQLQRGRRWHVRFCDFAFQWMRWEALTERRRKGKVGSWCCKVTLGEQFIIERFCKLIAHCNVLTIEDNCTLVGFHLQAMSLIAQMRLRMGVWVWDHICNKQCASVHRWEGWVI